MTRPRYVIEDTNQNEPKQMKLGLENITKKFASSLNGMRLALNWACDQLGPPDGKGCVVEEDPKHKNHFNITGPKGKGTVVREDIGGYLYWVATVPETGGNSNED